MGLFLLGPLLGVVVGYVAITLLDRVRSRMGVRRDYESLYALGVAFSAFAAAEAVGGSGFLAAFAAGLVVAAMDVELCDCFLDYGEASAEMFLLLTFVAFGASIIWTGFEVADVPTLIFAAVALSVRTVVLLPVLRLGGVDAQNRRIIALLGPSRAQRAAAGAAARLRRHRRVGAPVPDHLPGRAAVGDRARRRHRHLRPPERAEERRRRRGARSGGAGGGAGSDLVRGRGAGRSAGARDVIDIGEAVAERITIPELRRLWEQGRAGHGPRRPHRAQLPGRSGDRARRDTDAARGRRPPGAGAQLDKGGRLVLYCT